MNESLSARRTSIFRPGILNFFGGFIAAFVLGLGGTILYAFSTCWASGNNCVAFSPTRIFIAWLLSLPIFVLNWLSVPYFDWTHDVVQTYSILGVLVLWAYYYLIFSIGVAAARTLKGRKLRRL